MSVPMTILQRRRMTIYTQSTVNHAGILYFSQRFARGLTSIVINPAMRRFIITSERRYDI